MKNIILALSIISLAGCVSLKTELAFTESSKDKTKLIENGVTLYEDGHSGDFENLGDVEGNLCHRNAHTSIVSLNKVKNKLKETAKEKGANGVINMICSVETKTDWAKNCWGTATCSGTAIKY